MENQDQPKPTPIQESAIPLVQPTVPRQNLLFIVLVLLTVILFGSTIYLAYQNMQLQKKITEMQIPLTVTPSSTLTPSPSSTSKPVSIIVTLPVEILKTGYGIGPAGYVYPYKKTIQASIPQVFSDQLSAYGVSNQIIVGPKGWTGQGNVGADGGESVTLKPAVPQTNPGPYLTYSDDSACFACATGDAYAFFPLAKAEYDKNFPAPAEVPEVTNTHQLTPKLVAYSLANTSDNLEVNGVAFFEDINGSTSFTEMEIALPSNQHDLASVILNNFIAQFGLDKK